MPILPKTLIKKQGRHATKAAPSNFDTSNQSSPSEDINDTLAAVFPKNPDIVDRVLSLLGPLKETYRPLNLNGCDRARTEFLAYGTLSQRNPSCDDRWSSQYGAYTFQIPPANEVPHLQVTFVRGLLVGIIDADSHGSLKISANCWTAPGHLVIAPPPDPRLRNIPVWIRDWRYIPSTNGRGLFEILEKDIVLLTPKPPHTTPFRTLRPDLTALQLPQHIRGFVRAKSCIIGSKSSRPIFLTEISDALDNTASSAVIVIFRGCDAMKWWPFLSSGQEVGISALIPCKLPKYNERLVLAARGPESTCCDLSQTPIVERPQPSHSPESFKRHDPKKRKLETENRKDAITLVQGGHAMLTYEGEVTEVLGEGKLQLDHKVILYLGSFANWCAGPAVSRVCFRKGAKIVASWVMSFIREGLIRLFPTGRTSVDVQYFGDIDLEMRLPRSRQNVWRWIWKRWEFRDIIWAEDIYCALRKNLGSLFESTLISSSADIATETELIEYLLGTEKSVGLVQHAMFLLSGRKELLDPDLTVSRNLHAEFLSPNQVPETPSSRPAVPSLASIKKAVRLLWRKRESESASPRPTDELSTQAPVHVSAIFTISEILGALCERDDVDLSFSTAGVRGQGISLICLLQGSADGYPQATLSDATASMKTRIIGDVPPCAIGSIVVLQRFSVVIEFTSIKSLCEITLVIEGHSIEELLGGGTDDYDRTASCNGTRGSGMCMASYPGVRGSERTPRLVQRPYMSPTQHENILDSIIARCPLICIFVNKLTPRPAECVVTGALLAFCRSTQDEEWISFPSTKEGFYPCRLSLSGQSMLSFSIALRIGNFFAVSCTDLLATPSPEEHLREQLAQSLKQQSLLKLKSHVECEVPYVRSLGKQNKLSCFGPNQEDPRRHQTSPSGFFDKGMMTIHEGSKLGGYSPLQTTLRSLRDKTANSISFPLWDAFDRCHVGKEKVLILRGIVQYCGPPIEGSVRSDMLWQLRILDEDIEVISITIDFYDRQSIPYGITGGMSVIVHNVSRVTLQGGSRFRFVGNSTTFVDLIAVPSLDQNSKCLDCVSPPTIQSLCSAFNFATLSEFSTENERQGQQSCGTGIIRLRVLKVDQIQVKTMTQTNCAKCGIETVPDGSTMRTTISVTAAVEDGSAVGTLICKGWEPVTRLLGMKRHEVLALKTRSLCKGGFTISCEEAKAYQVSAFKNRQRDTLTDVCEVMPRVATTILT
ncbi:unnamed protein product [Chondrus crispus]|uniref:CST complex subunit CTC1 n=1 Tax=Chondrus crispus TaxID=2769 RepID=R7QD42_CHOCR|nr:unnamed protein product [Chondrus crispus]CDF35356.1 unnamed protein product [Chondrus crispus]|eukprot:XP_005715175.1 unnamed protein product [Chondrus crispus]